MTEKKKVMTEKLMKVAMFERLFEKLKLKDVDRFLLQSGFIILNDKYVVKFSCVDHEEKNIVPNQEVAIRIISNTHTGLKIFWEIYKKHQDLEKEECIRELNERLPEWLDANFTTIGEEIVSLHK